MFAVAAALLLLAESFGRDVIWLYRTGVSPRTRRALLLAITVLRSCSCGVSSSRPTVSSSSPRPPLSASPWKGLAWSLSRWCCRTGRDGSWRRSPESCSACSLSSRSSTWVSTRRSGGRSTRCSTGASVVPGCWRGTRRDRRQVHGHRARRALSRSHPAHWRNHRISDSHHHRGRPSSPRPRFADSLPSQRSGRCARACHCNSSRDSRSPRPAPPGWPSRRCATPRQLLREQHRFEQAPPQPRPRSQHPRIGPAHRIARQGRHHRLRRKLRAGRRPGHELLSRHRRRPAPGHRVTGPRRLVRAECLAHLPELRRGQLARPLHPAVGAVGQHRPAVCRAGRQPPVHPQRRLQQGRLAHRQRRPR